jgi:hypothetical protein
MTTEGRRGGRSRSPCNQAAASRLAAAIVRTRRQATMISCWIEARVPGGTRMPGPRCNQSSLRVRAKKWEGSRPNSAASRRHPTPWCASTASTKRDQASIVPILPQGTRDVAFRSGVLWTKAAPCDGRHPTRPPTPSAGAPGCTRNGCKSTGSPYARSPLRRQPPGCTRNGCKSPGSGHARSPLRRRATRAGSRWARVGLALGWSRRRPRLHVHAVRPWPSRLAPGPPRGMAARVLRPAREVTAWKPRRSSSCSVSSSARR